MPSLTKSPARSIMTSAATFGSETSTTRSPARDSPTTSPCRRCVSTMNARGSAPSATATSSGGPGENPAGGGAAARWSCLANCAGTSATPRSAAVCILSATVAKSRMNAAGSSPDAAAVASVRSVRAATGVERRRPREKRPRSPMDARALDDARRALVAPPVARAPCATPCDAIRADIASDPTTVAPLVVSARAHPRLLSASMPTSFRDQDRPCDIR